MQAELTSLRSAAKSLSAFIPRLQGAINSGRPLSTTAKAIGATMALNSFILPLYTLYGSKEPTKASPGMPIPSPPVVASPEETSEPMDWYLNTVPGTSVKDFQAWILTLPDKGAGTQYVYDSSNYQAYAGKWTLEEALIIHQDPLVNHQVPNTPQQGTYNFIRDNSSVASENELRRRDSPYKIIAREGSPRYLKILSLPKNKDIVSLQDTNALFDYASDESAGAGSYVYVFDGGFDWNHQVGVPRCPCILSTY